MLKYFFNVIIVMHLLLSVHDHYLVIELGIRNCGALRNRIKIKP